MKVAIFCNTRTASKLVLNRIGVLLKLKSLSEPFSNFFEPSKPYDLEYCKNIRDQLYTDNNYIVKIASFNYKISFDNINFIDYNMFNKIFILNRKNLTDIVCSIYAGEYVRNSDFEDETIDCAEYEIPANEVLFWYIAHQVPFIKVSNFIKQQNNYIEIFYEDLKNETFIRKQLSSAFNVTIDKPLYAWRESNIKNRCINYFEVEDALKKAQQSKSLNYYELEDIIYSSMGVKK